MADSTIKVRIAEKEGKIHLRALIKHPMETGLRKDAVTGIQVPAHYINRVVIEVNGETVLDADWSASISTDPYLYVIFDGVAGDKVRLAWQDNTGKSDSIETTVGG
jgi:sulfur-oxidizing protein SoxZ